MSLSFRSLDVMALCRFAYSYSPASASTIFRFPKYPSKHTKFSLLPLSFSTMEAPPEGYRRNVGICLMNNHKKVRSFLILMILVSDSYSLKLNNLCCADFRGFEARHSQCLANASGQWFFFVAIYLYKFK